MITLLVVIGILVLVVIVVVDRQSSGGWQPPSIDAAAPPQPDLPSINAAATPQLSLPGDIRQRVELLLAQDKKIEAVKEVRAATGLSLRDAKDYVDGVQSGVRSASVAANYAQPIAAGMTGFSPEVEREVRREIAAGNKIAAIKLVREATGVGLKEAKDFVEGLGAGVPLASVAANPVPPRPIWSGVIALSPDTEREVRRVLATGNKIAAIKLVRQATGAGLKEAKDFVEQM